MSSNKKKKKNVNNNIKKNKKKKKSGNFSLIAAVLLIIVLCVVILVFMGSRKIDDKPKTTKEITTTQPVKKLNIVDLNSNSRNIAVMINNISTVWGYQSGLQDAYIVYEMLTEGGISRLMGIFRDKDTERIGTVRSSRITYIDYVLENDAAYVHVGGSNEALYDIRHYRISDLDSVIFRDKSIGLSYEHTAFTSMEKIKANMEKRNIRNTMSNKLLLNYSVDPIDLSTKEGAIPANSITVRFSKSKATEFTYNPETQVYNRSQNGRAHTDYVTKQQYTAKNILVYRVKYSSYDSYGRQKVDNLGTGEGYFISNGYAVPITWSKDKRESQTVYRYTNGEEIKVNDGNTHIEIAPINYDIIIN